MKAVRFKPSPAMEAVMKAPSMIDAIVAAKAGEMAEAEMALYEQKAKDSGEPVWLVYQQFAIEWDFNMEYKDGNAVGTWSNPHFVPRVVFAEED